MVPVMEEELGRPLVTLLNLRMFTTSDLLGVATVSLYGGGGWTHRLKEDRMSSSIWYVMFIQV